MKETNNFDVDFDKNWDLKSQLSKITNVFR